MSREDATPSALTCPMSRLVIHSIFLSIPQEFFLTHARILLSFHPSFWCTPPIPLPNAVLWWNSVGRPQEPEIFDAVRFGAVVENAVFSEHDRVIDYHDISITENTRTAYPLEYIPNCKVCPVFHTRRGTVTGGGIDEGVVVPSMVTLLLCIPFPSDPSCCWAPRACYHADLRRFRCAATRLQVVFCPGNVPLYLWVHGQGVVAICSPLSCEGESNAVLSCFFLSRAAGVVSFSVSFLCSESWTACFFHLAPYV